MNTKIKKQTARILNAINANKLKQSITMLLLMMLIVTLPSCDENSSTNWRVTDITATTWTYDRYFTTTKPTKVHHKFIYRKGNGNIIEYYAERQKLPADSTLSIIRPSLFDDTHMYIYNGIGGIQIAKGYYYLFTEPFDNRYIGNDKIFQYRKLDKHKYLLNTGPFSYFYTTLATDYNYDENNQLQRVHTVNYQMEDIDFYNDFLNFNAIVYDRIDDYIWNNGNIVEIKTCYVKRNATYERAAIYSGYPSYTRLSLEDGDTCLHETKIINYTDIPSSKGAMILNLSVDIINDHNGMLSYTGLFGKLPKNMIESTMFTCPDNNITFGNAYTISETFSYQFNNDGYIGSCTYVHERDTEDSNETSQTRYTFEYHNVHGF